MRYDECKMKILTMEKTNEKENTKNDADAILIIQLVVNAPLYHHHHPIDRTTEGDGNRRGLKIIFVFSISLSLFVYLNMSLSNFW